MEVGRHPSCHVCGTWQTFCLGYRFSALAFRRVEGSRMRSVILLTAAVICTAPSPALAAPAELLNKTITVSYTVTIPGKSEDGSTVPGIRNASRTIYVSSKGRVFARVTRPDGRMSATKEASPGAAATTF